MAQLSVRQSRPRKLSNPDGEFAPDAIAKILATPDARLSWRQFHTLFGPYFTAGTYDEVLYFLPLAFDHIISHDEDALDLVTSLVWFVSEHDEKLLHDRLRNAARDRICDCLSHWTAQFDMLHFDRNACEEKGWGILYKDVVQNAAVVCEGTCDLVRFKQHADIAIEFVTSLAEHQGNDIKAAWFLEYSRCRFDVYTPPDDPQIQEILADRGLLKGAADVVLEHRVGRETSPTYWNDTFAKLELWDHISGGA